MSKAFGTNHNGGSASKVDIPSDLPVKASQFMLVTCRPTTSDENLVLAKHFKQIISYHAELNSNNTDLSKIQFDLLIVDVSDRANHDFLEMVHSQAKSMNVPIIVLKKSMTNYDELVEALGGTVIKEVKDLDSESFFNYLSKSRLPKFQGRSKCILKNCLGMLLKQ